MNEINFCAHTEWMINNLIYEDQADGTHFWREIVKFQFGCNGVPYRRCSVCEVGGGEAWY